MTNATAHEDSHERLANKSLLRAGGIAAILGGIVTQISGAMHPVETATIFDPATHLKEVAANPAWNAVYLGFSIGFISMLSGLTAIAKTLQTDRAAGLASIARSVAVATTALALVFFVVDGFATKVVASSLGPSPDSAALAAAGALDKFGRAFFGHWTFACWGVTPFLFGLAVARSNAYKKWLGVAPMVSGAIGITTGIAQDLSDFSLSMLPPFYAAVLIFDVWMITMGVIMVRRASSPVLSKPRVPSPAAAPNAA